MITIYSVTHIETRKSYIGVTQKTLKIRIKTHLASENRSYFQLTLSYYGIDSFKIKAIDFAITLNEAFEKEKFWIKELNTTWPNGYNLSEGGQTGKFVATMLRDKRVDNSGRKPGFFQSEETKRKMSLSKLGKKRKPFTPEHIKAMCKAQRKRREISI